MGIISDIQADLEKSARELLDEYKDRLMAEAIRLCKDESTAEDLVVCTFENYFFKQAKHDPERGSLYGWLRTILHNLYADSFRKRRVNEVLMSPEDIERIIDAQLPDVISEDAKRAEYEEKLLKDAVNSLSPKMRAAVVLHYFESMSVAEVARNLCVSEDSIKNRLFYARKVLAKRLGKRLGKGGVAAVCIALFSLVSMAAVATLPVLAPVRETVASLFAGSPVEQPPAEVPANAAAEPIAPITTFENNENTETKEEEPMKLTKTLKSAAVAAAMTLGTVGSASATAPTGSRIAAFPVPEWTSDNDIRNAWRIANAEAETANDCNFIAVYDIGTPHVVQCGVIFRSVNHMGQQHVFYGSNAPVNNANPDADGSGWTKIADMAEGIGSYVYSATDYNVIPRAEGTEGVAYRYYLLKPVGSYQLHIGFFTEDFSLQQDAFVLANDRTLGVSDAEGYPFSGKVYGVPDGGEATVTLHVAKVDHGDDLAAWESDATHHSFVADGTYASGSSFSLKATGLAAGVWQGRLFATAGARAVASQRTYAFVMGTRPYYPTAYFWSRTTATFNDGNASNYGEGYGSGAIYELDDPDVEVVGARLWVRDSRYSPFQGAFVEYTAGALDLGSLTEITSVSVRTNYTAELWPATGWTTRAILGKGFDFFVLPNYVVDVPLQLSDDARYVKYVDVMNGNWCEAEFRVLPRPAEPVATMALGDVGGTYVGLSGRLKYRGNTPQKSPCDIYVSCVPKNAEKHYLKLAEGWENGADWAGSVTGLAGETEYDLDVVVSNALAGVSVLSTSFTTLEATPEPPKVELISVTPDQDGNVTFVWNLLNTGSVAGDVDIYAQWKINGGSYCTAVKLAENVALGVGSAVSDQVVPGETLTFVVFAVNKAGSDEDGTRTSALSAAVEGTTFGPSSFESGSIVRADMSGALRISGAIGTIGLGTSEVRLAYAPVNGLETNYMPIATYTKESASRQFDATVTLPVAGTYFVQLQLVNAWKNTSWQTAAAEKTLLLGLALPMNVPYDMRLFSDGDLTKCLKDVPTQCGPVVFDLGNVRSVNGVIFALSTDGHADAFKTLVFEVSSDGKTWTKAWENDGEMVLPTHQFLDVPFAAPLPSGRYVRVSNRELRRLGISEFCAVGSGFAVTANAPRPWGSATSIGLDHSEKGMGAYLHGRLIGTLPEGGVRVYACVSRQDYGGDANAWLAKSKKVDLGLRTVGDAFSAMVENAPIGVCYTKLVAVSDDATFVSPECHRVVAGSRPYRGAAWVLEGTKTDGVKSYDGNVNTYTDGTVPDHVFPLVNFKGWRILGARVWPRNGFASRVFGMKVYVSTAPAGLESMPYKETPREVRTYASEPAGGFKWQELPGAGITDSLSASDGTWDVILGKLPENATYINIPGSGNVSEIELRIARPVGTVFSVR